jgi:hypothetical protein
MPQFPTTVNNTVSNQKGPLSAIVRHFFTLTRLRWTLEADQIRPTVDIDSSRDAEFV